MLSSSIHNFPVQGMSLKCRPRWQQAAELRRTEWSLGTGDLGYSCGEDQGNNSRRVSDGYDMMMV